MGFCDRRGAAGGAARRRVFLDTDPGFGADVARARAGRRLRRPRRARHDRGADRRATDCTVPDCGLRLDHDAAAGRARRVAGAAAASGRGCASPASRAGAAPTGRSTTTATATGCACTSSAASPSCPRARRRRVRAGARHPSGRRRATPALLRGRRLGAGRPRAVVAATPRRLPRATCRARAPS